MSHVSSAVIAGSLETLSNAEGMNAVEFAKHYADADQHRIAFASNGESGSQCVDSNREVRKAVCNACMTDAAIASDQLIRDLYDAETEYAKAVFGVWHDAVAFLANQLLARGGKQNVRHFLQCAGRSMDTWMSSRRVTLSATQKASVLSTLDAIADTIPQELTGRLARTRGNIESVDPAS